MFTFSTSEQKEMIKRAGIYGGGAYALHMPPPPTASQQTPTSTAGATSFSAGASSTLPSKKRSIFSDHNSQTRLNIPTNLAIGAVT
jgi:hypothetical protein